MWERAEDGMPKFSIITPSYNSWRFMDKYWSSLEQQTYKDFEVIIVDDCSTDDSFARLNLYAENSSLNIRIFQNSENRGPGYTRNRGMAEAEGEWVTFIDSDDSIDDHFLECAVNLTKKSGNKEIPINCIIFDYNIEKGERKRYAQAVYGNPEEGIQSVEECIAAVRNYVWGKFYRRDLVKSVNFPEMMRCEDVAFVCQAIDACCMKAGTQIGCVYYHREALYNYIQRECSLTKDHSLKADDMVEAYKVIYDKLGKKYPDAVNTKSIPDLLYGGVLLMCKTRKTKSEIKKYISAYEKENPHWYENSIINEIGRSKKLFLICVRHRWMRMLKAMSMVHARLVG